MQPQTIGKPVDTTKDFLFEKQISVSSLMITADAISRALGYKNEIAPDYFLEEIRSVCDEIASFNDCRAGCRIVFTEQLIVRPDGFSLGKTNFFTGKTIARNLKGCQHIAIFLTTAGNTISRKISDSKTAGNLLQSYIYDCAGSEMAEQAAGMIQAIIREKMAGPGFNITPRYSPGYCGWDVAEQKKLFPFLPENFCMVQLTDSAFMIPEKSVSGIIGISRLPVPADYGCADCTLATCCKQKGHEKREV